MLRKLFFLFSVVALTACMTGQPLYNADDVKFYQPLTSEKAKQAIEQALNYKRWRVVSADAQEVIGEIYVRSHYAKIRIPYSTNGFSIRYVDSKNLDYDGDDNEIHRNYNKWIAFLEAEILRYASMAD
ncbi:hypothetical protein [Alteromonas sp. C1M14]|uniref:hypothetical protein n=1 Tax=Alteromonas sp. C1M14 TaxID=2841567 RepID=UPI001C0A555D|nr:hypothetical protein [Alteromonas sp. C1M14]MBU2979672.1 hypothetical protein [Alteromonas sp. C1M14]